MMKKPYLIEFDKIGDNSIGFLSVIEGSKNIPFEIRRVFYTYNTPVGIIRGKHAHYKTEQLLIAVTGAITVNTEMPDGEICTFVLDKPNSALYLPPNAWHTMKYSPDAVQLALASMEYDPNDYIRDYDEFKTVYSPL